MGKLSFRREHFMYSYNKFMPQNLTFQTHHYYEVLFFVSGSAKYIIDGNEYTANPGDVFITAPNELHSIVFTGNEVYERHFVQFDAEFLSVRSPSLPARVRDAVRKHKISADDVKKYGIDKLFLEIQRCVSEETLEFEVIMQTYIIQMIVSICDCMSTSAGQPEKSSKKTQKIKDYINRNFTRALSLDEIAENVFFNKYYMCHVFKEDTGLTIKEYIELLRFMYARKLYAQGKKITDIAALCGYGDYSLFYKNFTKYSGGLSPKEFFSLNTHIDSSTPVHKKQKETL